MAETWYQTERLDHLGIEAGLCREIELAACVDSLDVRQHERVSVGTATVAMILNRLGFSNRPLYLAPQFFANKPVAHLLGPGIRRRISTTIVCGGLWTGCPCTARPRCSPASPLMRTPPRSPSMASILSVHTGTGSAKSGLSDAGWEEA
jgi:hypothetical protein